MSKPLELADEFKVFSWLTKNQAELKGSTSAQAAERAFMDTGIRLTQNQIKRIDKAARTNIFRPGVRSQQNFRATSYHDAMAILAKSIKQIAADIGIKLLHEDKVTMIIARRVTMKENSFADDGDQES